eukprot:Nk52_evm11s151 gene=Nk52_evmTU11s151
MAGVKKGLWAMPLKTFLIVVIGLLIFSPRFILSFSTSDFSCSAPMTLTNAFNISTEEANGPSGKGYMTCGGKVPKGSIRADKSTCAKTDVDALKRRADEGPNEGKSVEVSSSQAAKVSYEYLLCKDYVCCMNQWVVPHSECVLRVYPINLANNSVAIPDTPLRDSLWFNHMWNFDPEYVFHEWRKGPCDYEAKLEKHKQAVDALLNPKKSGENSNPIGETLTPITDNDIDTIVKEARSVSTPVTVPGYYQTLGAPVTSLPPSLPSSGDLRYFPVKQFKSPTLFPSLTSEPEQPMRGFPLPTAHRHDDPTLTMPTGFCQSHCYGDFDCLSCQRFCECKGPLSCSSCKKHCHCQGYQTCSNCLHDCWCDGCDGCLQCLWGCRCTGNAPQCQGRCFTQNAPCPACKEQCQCGGDEACVGCVSQCVGMGDGIDQCTNCVQGCSCRGDLSSCSFGCESPNGAAPMCLGSCHLMSEGCPSCVNDCECEGGCPLCEGDIQCKCLHDPFIDQSTFRGGTRVNDGTVLGGDLDNEPREVIEAPEAPLPSIMQKSVPQSGSGDKASPKALYNDPPSQVFQFLFPNRPVPSNRFYTNIETNWISTIPYLQRYVNDGAGYMFAFPGPPFIFRVSTPFGCLDQFNNICYIAHPNTKGILNCKELCGMHLRSNESFPVCLEAGFMYSKYNNGNGKPLLESIETNTRNVPGLKFSLKSAPKPNVVVNGFVLENPAPSEGVSKASKSSQQLYATYYDDFMLKTLLTGGSQGNIEATFSRGSPYVTYNLTNAFFKIEVDLESTNGANEFRIFDLQKVENSNIVKLAREGHLQMSQEQMNYLDKQSSSSLGARSDVTIKSKDKLRFPFATVYEFVVEFSWTARNQKSLGMDMFRFTTVRGNVRKGTEPLYIRQKWVLYSENQLEMKLGSDTSLVPTNACSGMIKIAVVDHSTTRFPSSPKRTHNLDEGSFKDFGTLESIMKYNQFKEGYEASVNTPMKAVLDQHAHVHMQAIKSYESVKVTKDGLVTYVQFKFVTSSSLQMYDTRKSSSSHVPLVYSTPLHREQSPGWNVEQASFLGGPNRKNQTAASLVSVWGELVGISSEYWLLETLVPVVDWYYDLLPSKLPSDVINIKELLDGGLANNFRDILRVSDVYTYSLRLQRIARDMIAADMIGYTEYFDRKIELTESERSTTSPNLFLLPIEDGVLGALKYLLTLFLRGNLPLTAGLAPKCADIKPLSEKDMQKLSDRAQAAKFSTQYGNDIPSIPGIPIPLHLRPEWAFCVGYEGQDINLGYDMVWKTMMSHMFTKLPDSGIHDSKKSKASGKEVKRKAFSPLGFFHRADNHHFLYGPLLYAFSVAAKYDYNWGQSHLAFVQDIAADIANPSPLKDERFPKYRYKDLFLGVSWGNSGGTDFYYSDIGLPSSESSGESANAWYSLYLAGLATDNVSMKNVGMVHLATEVAFSSKYLRVNPKRVFKAPNLEISCGSIYEKSQTKVEVNSELVKEFFMEGIGDPSKHPELQWKRCAGSLEGCSTDRDCGLPCFKWENMKLTSTGPQSPQCLYKALINGVNVESKCEMSTVTNALVNGLCHYSRSHEKLVASTIKVVDMDGNQVYPKGIQVPISYEWVKQSLESSPFGKQEGFKDINYQNLMSEFMNTKNIKPQGHIIRNGNLPSEILEESGMVSEYIMYVLKKAKLVGGPNENTNESNAQNTVRHIQELADSQRAFNQQMKSLQGDLYSFLKSRGFFSGGSENMMTLFALLMHLNENDLKDVLGPSCVNDALDQLIADASKSRPLTLTNALKLYFKNDFYWYSSHFGTQLKRGSLLTSFQTFYKSKLEATIDYGKCVSPDKGILSTQDGGTGSITGIGAVNAGEVKLLNTWGSVNEAGFSLVNRFASMSSSVVNMVQMGPSLSPVSVFVVNGIHKSTGDPDGLNFNIWRDVPDANLDSSGNGVELLPVQGSVSKSAAAFCKIAKNANSANGKQTSAKDELFANKDRYKKIYDHSGGISLLGSSLAADLLWLSTHVNARCISEDQRSNQRRRRDQNQRSNEHDRNAEGGFEEPVLHTFHRRHGHSWSEHLGMGHVDRQRWEASQNRFNIVWHKKNTDGKNRLPHESQKKERRGVNTGADTNEWCFYNPSLFRSNAKGGAHCDLSLPSSHVQSGGCSANRQVCCERMKSVTETSLEGKEKLHLTGPVFSSKRWGTLVTTTPSHSSAATAYPIVGCRLKSAQSGSERDEVVTWTSGRLKSNNKGLPQKVFFKISFSHTLESVLKDSSFAAHVFLVYTTNAPEDSVEKNRSGVYKYSCKTIKLQKIDKKLQPQSGVLPTDPEFDTPKSWQQFQPLDDPAVSNEFTTTSKSSSQQPRFIFPATRLRLECVREPGQPAKVEPFENGFIQVEIQPTTQCEEEKVSYVDFEDNNAIKHKMAPVIYTVYAWMDASLYSGKTALIELSGRFPQASSITFQNCKDACSQNTGGCYSYAFSWVDNTCLQFTERECKILSPSKQYISGFADKKHGKIVSWNA